MTCLREAVAADDGRYRSPSHGRTWRGTGHAAPDGPGDFADLDAAVELYRDALAATATGSASYADVAASLSDALDLRTRPTYYLAS